MSCVPVVEQSAPGIIDRFVAGLGHCRGGGFTPVLGVGCGHGSERNRGFVSGGHERGRLWPDSAGNMAHQWALERLGCLGSVTAFAGAGVRPVVPEPRKAPGLIHLPTPSSSSYGSP